VKVLGANIDFEQDIINTAIDQWSNCRRSSIRARGGHFEHIL